ncbi:MAG TPA: Xaa-Pro peptidase family protein [Deltaproteobacteria bacterium]|jgi:Xaa-Pro aminopeptidase|nr:Xaa-Pro peptidase family protein [Deltaproteobacteria bacterium]HOI05528.1 Xaa-Pro peptidase family protein [Deltaproteobacteria bacterium]
MNVYIDFGKRLQKIREEMAALGIDVFIGTRIKSVTFTAGAFIPWRSAVIVSRDGHAELVTMLIDNARMHSESWLETITPYAPIPGLDLFDMVVSRIRQHGWDRASIGVELGHSPRGNSGFLFATEYDLLKAALPEARFVNSLAVTDRASYVKEEGEIQLLRQASAMTDAAMEQVRESLYVGISETEIAGIGEMELRRLGSEYHWAVTGSSEVASGYRATWPSNGTTQPTTKLVQKGENLIVDLHSCHRQYLGDLAHNFILGQPSTEQRKLADAYVQIVDTILASFKAGNTVGQAHRAISAQIDALGYAGCVIPSFGHGLGVLGHEWYPPIIDNDEYRDVVLEANAVEVAFLAMSVPGVAGMRLECPILITPSGGEPLCRTPFALTVIDA